MDIVEIGAGLGDLTNKLLGLGNITSYEVDKELIPYLQERFKKELESKRLSLIIGDVLEIWQGRSFREEPYFLVANLPYYIATLIIVKCLKDPRCKGLLVMVQKEVAEKFCAKSGDSNFSALSVLAQSTSTLEYLFSVPPEAFTPAPKVDSAVFLAQKVESQIIDSAFLENLESLLKVAFNAPRKTILNNLSKAYSKECVESALKSLEIPPTFRPHQLDTPTYHRLLKLL